MRIRWRGFELPSQVVCDEKTRKPSYAKFMIEPFERGFGVTIGNSLRRVLLSSLEGAAVTSVKIEGVQHEFAAVEGVFEDVADILLNIKQIRVRMLHDQPSVMRIDVKRKGEVTGADIVTEAGVEVVNKDLVLCNLTKPVAFSCELAVAKGRGYITADENEGEEQELGRIPVDSIFSPVTRVKYHVEDARVGQKINYDRLVMEIWTDGTVAPDMALVEAAKILRKHLNPFVSMGEPGVEALERPAAVLTASDVAGDDAGERLKMPIAELNLSVRASHCLENENIHTVGDLVRMSEDDLLQVRNFGKTSLDEVKSKLESLGLSLSQGAEAGEQESAEE